jgi:hypothetical protein
MLGTLLALLIVLLILYFLYRKASKCQPGETGILCKLWHMVS